MAQVAVVAALAIASGIAAKASADKQARQLEKVGELEAEDQRRANRRVLGAQQAAFGASGVSAGAGSPLDVLADSVAEGELTALRRKFGRDSGASALRAQGSQALLSSVLGAGATVLGGLGSGQSKPGGTPKTGRGATSKPGGTPKTGRGATSKPGGTPTTGRGATRNRPGRITSSWTNTTSGRNW